MQVILVYITCSDTEEAAKIASALLDEHLIACANIVSSPVHSLYVWKGQREDSREILLLLKTTEDRFKALCNRVRTLHSYEVPCIVSVPIADGNPEFIEWVIACTHPVTN